MNFIFDEEQCSKKKRETYKKIGHFLFRQKKNVYYISKHKLWKIQYPSFILFSYSKTIKPWWKIAQLDA